MKINVSKCAFMMKYYNVPSLRPDENSVPIEDEQRARSHEVAQTLATTKNRLSCSNRKAVVSDKNDRTLWNRYARKHPVEQLHLGVETWSAVVLLPLSNY